MNTIYIKHLNPPLSYSLIIVLQFLLDTPQSRPMPVPGLSLLGPKRIRGFVSILRYINPTIIIIKA